MAKSCSVKLNEDPTVAVLMRWFCCCRFIYKYCFRYFACVCVCVCVCGGGWFMFCCAVISVVSSFAITKLRKEKLVALL